MTHARDLRDLVERTGASHLRVTPWRLLVLEDAKVRPSPAFLNERDHPLQRVSACPGEEGCRSGRIRTRLWARMLAEKVEGSLHVSGCPKGCARQRPADVTVVGREGGFFDLVRNGCAGDTPVETGLTEQELVALLS